MKIRLPNGVALETESESETALLLEKLGLTPKTEQESVPPVATPEPPMAATTGSTTETSDEATEPQSKAWQPLRVGLFIDKFDVAAVSGRVLDRLYRGPIGGIATVELARLLSLESTKGLGSVLGTFRRVAEEMGEPPPVDSHVGRDGFKVFALEQQFRSGWALLKQQKGAA